MASNGREARRRRIVDKGSDRLALITGQIQNLQPGAESESPEARHSHTASCPPYLSRDHQQPDHPSLGAIAEDKIAGHLSGNHASGIQPSQNNNYEGENRTGPFIRKCESHKEANRAAAADRRSKEPAQASSAANSSISASGGGHHNEMSNYPNIFTPYKIISAIKACETPRIRCSLAAAVIVVLCYVGFPILGSGAVKSIILFRPLIFLLLTNISIVVSHILLDKGTVKIQPEASNGPSADDTDLADQVGKALENGLMAQKIIGALFIDSSVYAISVICSISFAQKLGW
ncbi:uncharacterized protein LOC116007673 [Ipomoea triloba]|uniref:uncharacterized protein LOC116007673 n=1 Tax=Ipomoea triloba TaxID=35885 RepID=UPI00125D8154|nr:uncharacterized protein LOC116007673 [Ipomoea triloba]GMD42649.1 ATP-dependent 6-phosphofructokinase [Ipomoea batatas]GMD46041.1 ATP-dependent 6-phosphofructokinase [Ipomoea batatas]